MVEPILEVMFGPRVGHEMLSLDDRPPPTRRVGPAVQQEQRPTVMWADLLDLDLEHRCFDEAHDFRLPADDFGQ